MSPISDIGRSMGEAVMEGFGRAAGRVQERTPLPADILESGDAYLVVFDTPGARASDIQVRYVEGSVRIRVDRFREFYDGFEMRFPGRGLALDGRVDLPGDAVVNAETATATLRENGTLEVRVPKADHPSDPARGGSTVTVQGATEADGPEADTDEADTTTDADDGE